MWFPNLPFCQSIEEILKRNISSANEIFNALMTPHQIISSKMYELYEAFSDKLFWLALTDIHSITSGKLKDWVEEEEDLFEIEIKGNEK